MGAVVFDEVELGPDRLTGEGGGELVGQACPFPLVAPAGQQEAGIRARGGRVEEFAQPVGARQGVDGDVIEIRDRHPRIG